MPWDGRYWAKIAPIFYRYWLGLAWEEVDWGSVQAVHQGWRYGCLQLRSWIYWLEGRYVALDQVVWRPLRWLNAARKLYLRQIWSRWGCRTPAVGFDPSWRQSTASQLYHLQQYWCAVNHFHLRLRLRRGVLTFSKRSLSLEPQFSSKMSSKRLSHILILNLI